MRPALFFLGTLFTLERGERTRPAYCTENKKIYGHSKPIKWDEDAQILDNAANNSPMHPSVASVLRHHQFRATRPLAGKSAPLATGEQK